MIKTLYHTALMSLPRLATPTKPRNSLHGSIGATGRHRAWEGKAKDGEEEQTTKRPKPGVRRRKVKHPKAPEGSTALEATMVDEGEDDDGEEAEAGDEQTPHLSLIHI